MKKTSLIKQIMTDVQGAYVYYEECPEVMRSRERIHLNGELNAYRNVLIHLMDKWEPRNKYVDKLHVMIMELNKG